MIMKIVIFDRDEPEELAASRKDMKMMTSTMVMEISTIRTQKRTESTKSYRESRAELSKTLIYAYNDAYGLHMRITTHMKYVLVTY